MDTPSIPPPESHRGMFYPLPTIDFNLDGGKGAFDFKDFTAKMNRRVMELNMAFFLGEVKEKSEEEKLLDRLKYARVSFEGKTGIITYVDNETYKAYRMHDNSYYDGLLYPLQEIPDCTFERWCRGMDL